MATTIVKPPLEPDRDYYFARRELIPHFPVRAFELNRLGYKLPSDLLQKSRHLSPSFIDGLKALPQEIRNMIYKQAIFSNASENNAGDNMKETCVGTSFDDDHRNGVDLSFRYISGISSNIPNMMLGSSRVDQYSSAIQFVYSLALHEKFYLDSGRQSWHSPSKSSSILKNFLGWFWEHLQLHITDDNHYNNYEHNFKFLVSNPRQYECIRNIRIQVLLTTQPLDERETWASPWFTDPRRMLQMISQSGFLPQIQNLILNINLQTCAEHILKGELITFEERFAPTRRWIRDFRLLPIWTSFEVVLHCVYGEWLGLEETVEEHWKSELLPLRPGMELKYSKMLESVMKPYSLSYGTANDLPDDLGLRDLFLEEE